MSETSGVFRLEDIIEQKLENEWVDLENVWISPSPFFVLPPNTGYFGGASVHMDKVTYASDTTAAVVSDE